MTDDAERQAAFEQLTEEVYEPLQRYLRRRCAPVDVDGVFNDALLAIWRRLDAVPSGRAMPWCYGVARNCLANYHRGSNRRLRLVGKIGTAATPPEPTWTSAADADLHDALGQLSESDREMIRLWAWERLEPREIAEVLDTTANTVSVRLSKIRRQLESDITTKNQPPAGHEPFDSYTERET
ncbi:MAG: RNA polymerase sigma-70 factor (ECF subfamily) [Candidatus Aldehydirespiratoraceae bacterium]